MPKRLRAASRQLIDSARDLRQHETHAESHLWLYLRYQQLGVRIRRQHAVDRYVLDFYVPSLKLGIELDGTVHDSAEAAAQDMHRSEMLASLGITVMRFRNEDVLSRTGWVLEQIRGEMRKQG